MIQRKRSKNYSKRVKHVRGAGFMDIIKSFGSYINQNKDLIAKPVLAGIGELEVYAVNKGVKALMDKILSKERVENKGVKAMEKILSRQRVENIIGSGI